MPILLPDLRTVLVHLPKTGGTWVEETVVALGVGLDWRRSFPGLPQHATAHHPAVVAKRAEGWRIIGTVRPDPGAWYGSVWRSFGGDRCRNCNAYSSPHGGGWRGFLRGVTIGGPAPGIRRAAIFDQPEIEKEIRSGPLGQLRAFGWVCGLWTWWIAGAYATRDNAFGAIDGLLRTDRLRSDLAMLLGHDAPLDEERFPARSTSGPPAETPIDAEAEAWIEQGDGIVIRALERATA